MTEAAPREPNRDPYKLVDLLGDFDTGMLVTRSPSGSFHAVPLHVAHLDDVAYRLTFVTGDDTRKVEEVLSHPMVAVTFQGGSRYLSVSGIAHVERDVARASELWTPSMGLWFEGPEDPRIALLMVEIRRGEYWDRSGLRGLRFLARAGRALIEGETLSDDLDTTHAEVRL